MVTYERIGINTYASRVLRELIRRYYLLNVRCVVWVTKKRLSLRIPPFYVVPFLNIRFKYQVKILSTLALNEFLVRLNQQQH